MNIIDHGKWVSYKPDPVPKDMPPNAMYAKRESDGADWYEYSRNADNFRSDTVKFIAFEQDTVGWVVGAAVRDVSMLFPANCIVCEIDDYDGADPQRELGQKVFDLTTKTLGAWPKPPGQRKNPMELVWELEKRVEALEKKIK